MLKRTIAGAVLVAILAAVIYLLPEWSMAILLCLMVSLASYEMLYGTGLVKDFRLNVYSAAFAIFVCMWSYFRLNSTVLLAIILGYHALLFGEVLLSSGKLPIQKVAMCWLSGLVVPLLLSSLLRLRMAQMGQYLVLIPFIMAFVSDTGAYLVGVAIGKHKMCPNISPKKSWEGFFGGIVAAVLVMLLFAFLLSKGLFVNVSYFAAVIYGVLGALAGVFGDLSMSVIKRQAGIKDYGNLIPGHGGILDRFDSVLVTAPLAELLLVILPLVG